MADRDVRLIIRAKDEASKAIDSVADAIRDLTSVQKGVTSTAGATGNLLSDLTNEFRTLQNTASGLTALERVADQINVVKTAVSSLQGETRRAAADLAKSARDYEKASASTAKLRTEIERLEAQHREEAAAAEAARKGTLKRADASKDLARAERDYQKVLRATEGLENRAAQSHRVFATADLERAQRAVAENAATYRQLDTQAKSTAATLSDYNRRLIESERHETSLGTAIDRHRDSLREKRKVLTESRVSLGQLEGVARETATALGQVGIEQHELADATERATQRLNEEKALLSVLNRYSVGDGGFSDPRQAQEIQKQRVEVERVRREYELLSATAERMRRSMQAVSAPTREQVASLKQIEAATRQARIELDRQITSLNELPGAARNMNGLRGMFSTFYGESRQAMSLFQRLRGEVLSLATAYLGLYGAINNIRGVITSYQALEAAQNRLGAVFDQNQKAIRTELDWLERQAARLGIEFGILSQQYGKFAVAARAANFESEATRKIFLSVAEAGRVNKLSIEQLEGVFMALEQMISKGKVTSEELRRQLGDRLPGAFNIMADAIGVSTAELDAMMKRGDLMANQETLTAFAEQLTERFGSQLPEALRSTTTLLGKFRNEIFQAQLRVGEGGFIEALNESLTTLIAHFQSREGRDFFLSLGAALGNATRILTFFAENLDIVITLIQLLVAFKAAQWVLSMAMAFKKDLLPSLRSSVTGLRSVRTTAVAAGGGLMGAAAGARAFGAALRSIPAMFVLTGLTFALEKLLGNWIGGVEEATRNIDIHKQLVGEVVTAYEEARDAAEDWKNALPDDTRRRAESNFISQMEAFEKALGEVRGKLFDLNNNALLGSTLQRIFSSEQVNKVRDLVGAFDPENIEGFIAAIDELDAQITDIEAKKLLLELRDLAVEAQDAQERMGQAAIVADEFGSQLPEVGEAAEDAGGSLDVLSDAAENVQENFLTGTEALEGYVSAMDKLKEGIPSFARELEKAKEIAEVTEAFHDAIDNAAGQPTRIANARGLYEQNIAAIEARYAQDIQDVYRDQYRAAREVNDSLVNTASRYIGLSENDPTGRAALQSFFQSANQNVDPKMVAWCAAFVNAVLASNGLEGTGALNARSFLDYGEGTDDPQPGDLVVLKRGNSDWKGHVGFFMGFDEGGNVRVLGGNQGDEVGVDSFAAQDVLGFRRVPGAAEQDLANWEAAAEETERQAEAAERAAQATREMISNKAFEVEQARLIAEGKGREAAIEAAIRQARLQNTNITAAQIAQIRQLTGALYDQQNAGEAVRLAEEKVNQLYALRSELLQQIEFHEQQGNSGNVETLKQQVADLDDELRTAIDHAIALMNQLGGAGMDLAIAKMKNYRNSLVDVGEKAKFSGEEITKMLASGLTNMFDRLARSIANGENAIQAIWMAFRQFAADFLLQIARMIMQQALFNALQGVGNSIGSFMSSLFHTGGEVGSTVTSGRAVSPMWFRNAARYHDGGIAGIRPGEVPAILKVGEEVLTENDPRHRANGGGASGGGETKIVNLFDAPSFLNAALSNKVGEKAIMNFVRANASAFRSALNG